MEIFQLFSTSINSNHNPPKQPAINYRRHPTGANRAIDTLTHYRNTVQETIKKYYNDSNSQPANTTETTISDLPKAAAFAQRPLRG